MSTNGQSRTSRRQIKTAAAIACAVGLPAAALAQGMSPQPRYYIGEGSVELQTGTLIYEDADASIGPEGPARMEVKRTIGTRGPGSASAGPFGLYTTSNVEFSIHRRRYLEGSAGPGYWNYSYQVQIGKFTQAFDLPYGASEPQFNSGSSGQSRLVGTFPDGPFTYYGEDGLVVEFPAIGLNNIGCWRGLNSHGRCVGASSATWSNGLRFNFSYESDLLTQVVNNYGYGFRFAYNSNRTIARICPFNRAFSGNLQACTAANRSVSYDYRQPSSDRILKINYIDGRFTELGYSYNPSTLMEEFTSIKHGGGSAADVQIEYWPNLRRVKKETFGDGRTISYVYADGDPVPPNDWPYSMENMYPNPWVDVTVGQNGQGATTRHMLGCSGFCTEPDAVIDPLGRRTDYTYEFVSKADAGAPPAGNVKLLRTTKDPEGGIEQRTYGIRDNLTEVRKIAKPGSGLPDVVTSATYASPCTYVVWCSKPLSQTDARGNTTSYTYDNVHGGVLTETGPAVGGIAPVKRYSYAQRYAWLSNGAGGYVQAATPVWLLTEERTCVATATIGNACQGGSADEVVTSYDYGPNSGPNNLALRGRAVTSNGITLRTCFGYDADGNRISETAPNANLSACP